MTVSAPPLKRTPGLRVLAVCFLVVSIAVETAYSWRHVDAYYWVKVVGWGLLAVGIMHPRDARASSITFLAAGWAWMAANFWRGVADRLRALGAGGSLRLGTIEIVFAAACVAVCVAGLIWSLIEANRSKPGTADPYIDQPLRRA